MVVFVACASRQVGLFAWVLIMTLIVIVNSVVDFIDLPWYKDVISLWRFLVWVLGLLFSVACLVLIWFLVWLL